MPFDSLGMVYALGTEHLGFRMLGDRVEGHGAGCVGRRHARFDRFFANLVQMSPAGRYRIDAPIARRRDAQRLSISGSAQPPIGTPRARDEPISQEHETSARDAGSHQRCHRDLAATLPRGTGSSNLSLGGGVALNSVINGRIARETGFANIYISPAPHDGGTALGAAAYHVHHELGLPRPDPWSMRNSARRSRTRTSPVHWPELAWRMPRSPIRRPPPRPCCSRGWSWVGSRVRPNRAARAQQSQHHCGSRKEANLAQVSQAIKGREGFRPIAPAVLEERYAAYFPDTPPSLFMSYVVRCTPTAARRSGGPCRRNSAAAVDQPQANSLFHKLVSCFAEATGVPAVINTLFNVSGEPMVMKPEDAIRTYCASSLDALVMGNFVMRKPGAVAGRSVT